MNQITLLSQSTIDKIAAGEVVERPASVVKELVENAIDAGANAITVEIREGGIQMIRITDNGCGIPMDEVRTAFLRHATSKIRTVEDLLTSGTLGFRGEALSSIAAVSQVELITKTAGSITGARYTIEGGMEQSLEEIGAPEGTTFLIRNLFFNTPARRKFLKSATTEAGYISDVMERMALSHPEISFKFINNSTARLHTSGNCNLKDIIYGIYGRDIAANVVKVISEDAHIRLSGFIGKPVVSRGNRNYENYFVNGRYVKSAIIARAIEDAYKPFMMNHRYPFTALMVHIDSEDVDVNVHPTKMEVRFSDQQAVYDQVLRAVRDTLAGRELIPEFTVDHPVEQAQARKQADRDRQETCKKSFPEPFEKIRSQLIAEANSPYEIKYPQRDRGALRPVTGSVRPTSKDTGSPADEAPKVDRNLTDETSKVDSSPTDGISRADIGSGAATKPGGDRLHDGMVQMELFEDRLLREENRSRHKLIGQVFDTYWIVEFDDKVYIIDQHAAHEKVLYERFLSKMKNRQQTSQMITPPVIVTLSLQEEEMLKAHMQEFTSVGFEIEPFGGREYSIRAVPDNLYGIADRTLFLEILDGLTDVTEKASSELISEKIASMSCKAAVKGNSKLSVQEVDALIGELLTLDNPYNCPHGRPTIISMSKYELEKKFKRIV
jgi:DNA mismatch repair protein MutL